MKPGSPGSEKDFKCKVWGLPRLSLCSGHAQSSLCPRREEPLHVSVETNSCPLPFSLCPILILWLSMTVLGRDVL